MHTTVKNPSPVQKQPKYVNPDKIRHYCHVENMMVSGKCSVESCMWHSYVTESGCIEHTNIEPKLYMQLRSIKAPESMLNRCAANIQSVLILYQYLRYVKPIAERTILLDRSKYTRRPLVRALRKYPLNYKETGAMYRWKLRDLIIGLEPDTYATFLQLEVRNASKHYPLPELLNLSEGEYATLLHQARKFRGSNS